MAEEMQNKVTKNGKEYDCGEIEISTEKWYSLLNEPKAKQYIEVLVAFLREPGHKGSCYTVAQKHNDNPQSYNAKVMHFGKWVNAQIDNFTVLGTDDNPTYWAIPMRFGWETKEGFVWQMREELVEALRKFLLEKLIFEFEQQYIADPHDVKDEIYKWELLQKTSGQTNVEIAKTLIGKNIVDNPRVDMVLKYLSNEKPAELDKIVSTLFTEEIELNERIASFRTSMLNACPVDWKNCANDERTASAFLTCKYPDKYTFYMYKVYRAVCYYLGLKEQKAGLIYSHFLKIVNGITQKYGETVQSIISGELSSFEVKPKSLSVQTMFWVMLNEMKQEKITTEQTMTDSYLQSYIDLLKANHNIILNGAPGTGKTHLAKEIAKEMNATVKMVQFHPSYDYTDFVEGLRPIKDEKGNICFERKDGVFKEFCKKAINEPTSPFVFIIDEINRGEISKIFGELFYSIDPGYRGEKGKVQTQYQNLVEEGDVFKEGFYVPENVYIIGTMNDIDRSVESMDFAMRRRFAWQEITANESAQNMGIEGELLERMERLNAVIFETEGLGSSYQVGASMFLKVKEGNMTEEQLWNLNLKSLMKEYLRGLPQAEDILDKMKKAYFLEGDSEDDAHANDDVSAEY